MPKLVTLECPECAHRFRFLRHPADEPLPRFCPACGHDSQADDSAAEMPQAVTAPHIKNRVIVAAVDGTYRAMEEASEANMYAAAEAAGCDVSDMASLKITDMKDNLREGDVAAMPINPASQTMAAAPGIFGFQAQQQGAGFAAAAHTGPHAFAGLNAATGIKAAHGRAGGTVTDMPALEIQARQPRAAMARR